MVKGGLQAWGPHWQYGSNTPLLVHNDEKAERWPFFHQPSLS